MHLLTKLCQRIRCSEDGATAVEYALLVAGVAGLVIALVFALGGIVTGAFGGTCDKVKSGTTGIAASTCS